ncbi:MAG: hypothetical protein KDD47_19695, partial [Acidobacteria bacterium]|nr:hypothetical protein [Acidobacteriota bacterium]
MTRDSRHPARRASILALSLLLLPLVSTAEPVGRRLHLLDSPPLEEVALGLLQQPGLSEQLSAVADEVEGSVAPVARRSLASLPAPPVALAESVESGCESTPASPSVGADVPESYFGVSAPTVNPSLVGRVQLLTSGPIDLEERTITLPLYRGTLRGQTPVWFIATDTTDPVNAEALGLNHSAKLAFAVGLGARPAVLQPDGTLDFRVGGVDFSPERRVAAGAEPNPFPPSVAQPGAVGSRTYSPLARILNAGGHVYNMPIIAFNAEADELNLPDGTPDYTKVHDRVVRIDPEGQTVTLELVPGFSFGRAVLYLSTDASEPDAAAIEKNTFAPGLRDIDVGNDDSLFSAVERLFLFTNGARGCDNPHRQGLGAALTDGNTPFNVLGGIPTIATDYSP